MYPWWLRHTITTALPWLEGKVPVKSLVLISRYTLYYEIMFIQYKFYKFSIMWTMIYVVTSPYWCHRMTLFKIFAIDVLHLLTLFCTYEHLKVLRLIVEWRKARQIISNWTFNLSLIYSIIELRRSLKMVNTA